MYCTDCGIEVLEYLAERGYRRTYTTRDELATELQDRVHPNTLDETLARAHRNGVIEASEVENGPDHYWTRLEMRPAIIAVARVLRGD